jgi:hypothetical protein
MEWAERAGNDGSSLGRPQRAMPNPQPKNVLFLDCGAGIGALQPAPSRNDPVFLLFPLVPCIPSPSHVGAAVRSRPGQGAIVNDPRSSAQSAFAVAVPSGAQSAFAAQSSDANPRSRFVVDAAAGPRLDGRLPDW